MQHVEQTTLGVTLMPFLRGTLSLIETKIAGCANAKFWVREGPNRWEVVICQVAI